jgi:hypothetical protein
MHSGTQILAILASACFVASGLVLARLHTLPTGLDWRVDAVSDYGTGAYHLYYRALVVLLGAGAGLLLAALVRDTEAGNVGFAFLGAFGAARLAIAFFMTDLPGRPPTTPGRVHLVLAAVAFTSIAFATRNLTEDLVDLPGWDGSVDGWLRFESSAVVVTAILTLGAYLMPNLRERIFGIVERCLYVASLAWLLTAAIHLAVLV